MVGRTVIANQPGPINPEGYIEVLKANVVHDLVVRPLGKSRIKCNNRFLATQRQPTCQSNGMLFGNADIIHSFWKYLGKAVKTRSVRHCRCDRDNGVIAT